MIKNRQNITCSEQYLISRGIAPETCVFFDIETTGFKAASSHLYLIGAACRLSSLHSFRPEPSCITGSEGNLSAAVSGTVSEENAPQTYWIIVQWMAENPGEEAAILQAFADFLHPFDTLLHFNGDRFDLPYLEEKYQQHGIVSPFLNLNSVDLFRDFRPLKSFLRLDHMNQKSLEQYLGLERDDRYDGGRLIPVYRDFVKTSSRDALALLLLHNREDVSGMFALTSLYGYLDFLQTQKWEASAKLLESKTGKKELLFTFPLRTPVPVPFSRSADFGYLTLNGAVGKLLAPLLEGTLYYFFPDYKNYYYLPQEDQAIHKSVAAYVDKDFRRPARPEDCYTKKSGLFLPQPEELFSPAFRRNYQDPLRWFAAEDTFLQDEPKLTAYLSALLHRFQKM